MRRVSILLIAAIACTGAVANAHTESAAPRGSQATSFNERVLIYRTVEDPSVPAPPAGCPFDSPNVLLGATVASLVTRGADGAVVNSDIHQVGTASACGKITGPLVPFSDVFFYVEFYVAEGTIAANGQCKVISNNVPTPGLILAGCALRVTSAPAGIVGGSATSNSVFNPLRLPGFDTGSYWTLRLYSEQ